MHIAFESGASQITGGSIAVKNPALFENWLSIYGSERIILGADANNEKIATNGWLEESDQELIPFVKKYIKKGVTYVICTDINKDGMLLGPSFDLYQRIIRNCPSEPNEEGAKKKLQLIASGGISMFEELPKLAAIGCEGTIIGKAIYENKISLKQLEQFILNPTKC